MTDPVGDSLDAAFREEWGTVLAGVARRIRDLEIAEEATAEAFAAAAVAWERDGIPANPGAWLTTAAWRRALDLRRRRLARDDLVRRAGSEATRQERVREEEGMAAGSTPEFDDRLALVFACCHPALALESQVALTLRCVIGVSTEAIARSFLVQDRAMAQRLLRAKQKISASNIPIEVPPASRRPERMTAVRTVLYLILTQGYDSPATDLTQEGLWLARILHRMVPDDGEVTALLALALLHSARAASRWTPEGRPVPLEEQDRSLWDRRLLAEAGHLVRESLAGGEVGRYSVEAAIAATHASAPTWEDTDWTRIARLYRLLTALEPSPVVEVNRAVAIGMADGAPAGLAVLRPLLDDPAIRAYPPLHAAHGHLLDLLGDRDAALAAWARAADLTADPVVAAAIRSRHS